MAIFLTVEDLAYVVVFQGILSFMQSLAILAWVLPFYRDVCKRDQPPSEQRSVLITSWFGIDRGRVCPGVLTPRASG